MGISVNCIDVLVKWLSRVVEWGVIVGLVDRMFGS